MEKQVIENNTLRIASKVSLVSIATLLSMYSIGSAQSQDSTDATKGLCIDLSVADETGQTASSCPDKSATVGQNGENSVGTFSVQAVKQKPQEVKLSATKLVPQPPTSTATDGNLRLTLTISHATVKLGDSWNMKLEANKTCELQLIYQQSDGSIIDITSDFPQVVGGNILVARESRTIPVAEYQGSFKAALPLGRENIVAQCKVGGLSTDEVDVQLLTDNDLGEMPDISKGLFVDLSVASVQNVAEHAVVTMPIKVAK